MKVYTCKYKDTIILRTSRETFKQCRDDLMESYLGITMFNLKESTKKALFGLFRKAGWSIVVRNLIQVSEDGFSWPDLEDVEMELFNESI